MKTYIIDVLAVFLMVSGQLVICGNIRGQGTLDGTMVEETHMEQDIFRGEGTNKVDQFDQFFLKYVSFIYIASPEYLFVVTIN